MKKGKKKREEGNLLREVIAKIELKQEDNEEGIVVNV